MSNTQIIICWTLVQMDLQIMGSKFNPFDFQLKWKKLSIPQKIHLKKWIFNHNPIQQFSDNSSILWQYYCLSFNNGTWNLGNDLVYGGRPTLNKHRRIVSKNVKENKALRDVTNKKVPSMTSIVAEGESFRPGDFVMIKENSGNDCIWK